ncbi:hypothetical protein QQF64_024811 [Cirrhinus molitorella]|uniref:Uncharacterized protein n=1 Tax=Cirrhinus molitorella TaxID=172907 RepID=A0ABR3NN77_9TELE
MEPQSTMQERGGCRDPPSGPHRIPVAQLHPAIQLTQRNGSASVSPGCVGSSSRWGGGVGGKQGTRGLNYPPNQPLYQQQINVCQLSKQIGFATGKILQETVYPLLEQRAEVISEFLDYVCARVEGKGDPVSEGSSIFGWLGVRHDLRLSCLLLERVWRAMWPEGSKDSIRSQKAFGRP